MVARIYCTRHTYPHHFWKDNEPNRPPEPNFMGFPSFFNDVQFSLNFIDRLVSSVSIISPILKASPANYGISFIHQVHIGLFDIRGRVYYEHCQNFTEQSLDIGIAVVRSGSFAV